MTNHSNRESEARSEDVTREEMKGYLGMKGTGLASSYLLLHGYKLKGKRGG
jgi:hypothetical protein